MCLFVAHATHAVYIYERCEPSLALDVAFIIASYAMPVPSIICTPRRGGASQRRYTLCVYTLDVIIVIIVINRVGVLGLRVLSLLPINYTAKPSRYSIYVFYTPPRASLPSNNMISEVYNTFSRTLRETNNLINIYYIYVKQTSHTACHSVSSNPIYDLIAALRLHHIYML